MRLYFPDLRSGEKPIASTADYLEAQRWCDELAKQERSLRLEMKRQRDMGNGPDPKLMERLRLLGSKADQAMYEFGGRQPYVLVSRCPYCEKPIWMKVGIFSLADQFWYREDSDGREEVADESLCPHLFCVDGALNLNGHQPSEARRPMTAISDPDEIRMAAEVPFVKLRVLNLPTMVAVIHSFRIAERYTAYPVVYFTEQQPEQTEYCIGWARTEYFDHVRHSEGKPAGATFIGKRSDAQDYELEKWVRKGKLFWLDPEDEDPPLARGPVEAFPYSHVAGRRHPYLIRDGRVHDLRNPVQGRAEYDIRL
jgi:hypothetical protein